MNNETTNNLNGEKEMKNEYIVQWELRGFGKVWAVGTMREAIAQCVSGEATSMKAIMEGGI